MLPVLSDITVTILFHIKKLYFYAKTAMSLKFSLLLACLAMFLCFYSSSSAQAFEKGKIYLSAGWGYGNVEILGLKHDHTDFSSLGPFYLKGESAVGQH